MYPQLSQAAADVDRAFLIILGFSVFILVAVTAAMLFFLWRYNEKRHPVPKDSEGNVLAEIIWTVTPTIIVLGLFWTGWTSFKAMRTIPEGAMEVAVEGRMWSWVFTYENGKKSPELVVPVDTPVKLAMTTRDVIHSFYVPAMRLKWDLVPGMETDAWFSSNQTGEFDIFCAEYCGTKHADMITLLKVVPEEEFLSWLDEKPLAEKAVALMDEYGCYGCHARDGSQDLAPSLEGMAGRQTPVVLPDGSKTTVTADRDYIKRAILDPSAEVVQGYDDMMPPYGDEIPEENLQVILDHLAGGGKPEMPGKTLALEQGCISCHSTDGSENIGPTFLGLAGSMRNLIKDGKPVIRKADPAYLREAIAHPSTEITEGYEDMMPPYDSLSQEQLDQLVDWLGSLPAGEGG